MKKISYSFGVLSLYDTYAHFIISDGNHLDINGSKDLLKDLDSHYGKRPYTLISDRQFADSIDMNAYKHVNHKRLVGIAVVSNKENIEQDLLLEQELYKGSFAFFKNFEDAESWAKNFINDYN